MWNEKMSDMSVAPVQQAEPLRIKPLSNAAVVAVSIPPPVPNAPQSTVTNVTNNPFSSLTNTAVTSVWESASTEGLPEGVELDLIPFTDDGAILSDDLPQTPPPPAPKEAVRVKEEKEPDMETPRAFGLDPHPKTEHIRSKEAARVYEEERAISNAPRPEPIKPKWEQPAPVKAKFDALKDAEIAEILD